MTTSTAKLTKTETPEQRQERADAILKAAVDAGFTPPPGWKLLAMGEGPTAHEMTIPVDVFIALCGFAAVADNIVRASKTIDPNEDVGIDQLVASTRLAKKFAGALEEAQETLQRTVRNVIAGAP